MSARVDQTDLRGHQQDEPTVVLYGVPWNVYQQMIDILIECHWRHTYSEGTLESPSILRGVTWEDYKKLLDALGDYNLRHTYDGWNLEMMSPRKDHDWVKRLVGRMIEYMAIMLDIPIQSIGSTTLSSSDVEKGIQPDEAYYVQHEADVRGKRDYVPDQDPPPDLILEIDITNSIVKRLPTMALLKVPEIWRWEDERLQFFVLSPAGEYVEVAHSRAFPFLEPGDLQQFIDLSDQLDENSLVRKFGILAEQKYKSNP